MSEVRVVRVVERWVVWALRVEMWDWVVEAAALRVGCEVGGLLVAGGLVGGEGRVELR